MSNVLLSITKVEMNVAEPQKQGAPAVSVATKGGGGWIKKWSGDLNALFRTGGYKIEPLLMEW